MHKLLGLELGLALLLTTVAAEWPQPTLPLKADPTGHRLVDQRDRPFLYQADTAWMLFLNLTLDEAGEYFQVRHSQGFNVIQVMLTGFEGMTNHAGEAPFLGKNDLGRPNEAYFRHVDAVVEQAGRMNLVLAIAPLWAGCCGEGWAGQTKHGQPAVMNVHGVEKCRDFGRWLGRRYARHNHLLWILGGDNDPSSARDHYRALARGLKGAAPHQLLTYHAASSHSSTDAWPGEDWIDVSMIYTYFRGFNKAWNREQPDVYEVGWEEYGRIPARPFFLGESTYEGEHETWGSPLQARKQAYWAVLSGGTGHTYGSPNWRCETGWREGLQRPGAVSLGHLRRLFESRPWWLLAPDQGNRFVTAGHGAIATNDYAVAALANDGSFGVAYLSSPRNLTVDLTRLTGSRVQAWWFNPVTGQASEVAKVAKESACTFTPPAREGDADWVLVVDDAGKKCAPPGGTR
jgi:hypothetical protein